MKEKNLITCAALSLGLMLLSFTPPGSPAPIELRTGTYGVCGCSGASSGPNISLAINDDHTFHFVNATDPSEPVDVAGQWQTDAHKVILRTASGEVLETWTLDKNPNCLRSRKGLLFTRLCHLEDCR